MSDEIFLWRGDGETSETAQVVGEHVMALASRLGRPFDAITPDDVVEDARSPESPLHRYFQWDDRLAASSFRRAQARMLLSSIRYRVVEDEPRRIGFVNVRVEGVGRAYVPMTLAEHNDGLKKQALVSAVQGLRAWQHRCQQLQGTSAYALVGQAADAIEAELQEAAQTEMPALSDAVA